jgi:hypothetical protein
MVPIWANRAFVALAILAIRKESDRAVAFLSYNLDTPASELFTMYVR